MSQAIIECVPNFSEGRDPSLIEKITAEISKIEGAKLLDVDPGKATNRTVVTFVGQPQQVIDAAFMAIKKASELIDMTTHTGEHPRMGATDVCPLIPISNISMEETVEWAKKLGKRVGEELQIPIYLYEEAASTPERKNLATIRSGEYEGFKEKISKAEWKPDFGPAIFNERSGATVIGARDFLVAYNVNLNTTSVRRANSVAFDVREKGRIKRDGHPLNGTIVRDENGDALREPGTCKSVKAIGWFIEEYGLAQISMNLTNIRETNLHEAFEACRNSANNRGLRVTGSELVGLVPKQVMIDAGKYFLKQQERSVGISDEEIIRIAIKSMGLDELGPFDPKKKIIEYLMEDKQQKNLIDMNLTAFADETASESPAPGGGSISAYVGALGVALNNMVNNLSAHKKGWDDKWEKFSMLAEEGQVFQSKLMAKVDEDTEAFNKIMDAIRMPKATDEEKSTRKQALNAATKNAIEVPLSVMQICHDAYAFAKTTAQEGNPASISDVGVGVACLNTAIYGAYLNVRINCSGFGEKEYVAEKMGRAEDLKTSSIKHMQEILEIVESKI